MLSILSYKDEDDAVRIANDSIYRLAGYVWSGSAERATRGAARLKAARIFLNGAPITPSAPFGGYKRFGNGPEWEVFGLETCAKSRRLSGSRKPNTDVPHDAYKGRYLAYLRYSALVTASAFCREHLHTLQIVKPFSRVDESPSAHSSSKGRPNRRRR